MPCTVAFWMFFTKYIIQKLLLLYLNSIINVHCRSLWIIESEYKTTHLEVYKNTMKKKRNIKFN